MLNCYNDIVTTMSLTVHKIMFKEHGVLPMLSLTLFKIFPSRHIWATIFTHHLTPQVPFLIGALSSVATESVSQAIFKIYQIYLGHDLLKCMNLKKYY